MLPKRNQPFLKTPNANASLTFQQLTRTIALQLLIIGLAGAMLVFSQKTTPEDWLSQNDLSKDLKLLATPYCLLIASVALLTTLIASISPLLAMSGCVILVNSFDRYSVENMWNHYYGVNHLAALSVLVGSFSAIKKMGGEANQYTRRTTWFLVAYMLWICANEASHLFIANSGPSFCLRTWFHAFTAIAFVMILLNSKIEPYEIDLFAFALAIPLCYRRFCLGESLYLNHDFPSYAVCSIPMLIFVSSHGWILKRLSSMMTAMALVYMILETDNRGGFVGLLFSIAGLLLGLSWKIAPAVVFLMPFLMFLLHSIKPSFFKRFTDILHNGPAAGSFFSRFAIYSIAFSLPPITYVFGVGLGRFGKKVVEKKPELGAINAHNSWISALTELGILGLVFFSLLLTIATVASYQLTGKKEHLQRIIGLACLSAIFGYCGISLAIARDLFLPFYIISGIALSKLLNTRPGKITEENA